MSKLSTQTPAVTEADFETMAKVGGATLINMMRKATKDSFLAKASFSDWEVNFLVDVAKRAREFGDNLTPKQAEKARQILTKPAALTLLAALYSEDAKEDFSEIAPAPESKAPAYDYSADPSWGQF